jgi:hypothetical protein
MKGLLLLVFTGMVFVGMFRINLYERILLKGGGWMINAVVAAVWKIV